MTHCSSRLPPGSKPALIESPTGYPDTRQRICGQSVGVRTFLDGQGQERGVCALPGHEEDVRSLAAYDDALRLRQLDALRHDLRERARHEWEQDQRLDDRYQDWIESTR